MGLFYVWICYTQVYKEGDSVDMEGMCTVQKREAHKHRHGRTGRVHRVTQHAAGIAAKKNKLRARSLPREFTIRIEHIKHSKRQDSFLKCTKESDQKQKSSIDMPA